jgi:GMP synthase (glutamine-hydrolysing)
MYTHIIISGSATSCSDESAWVELLIKWLKKANEVKIPVLGICFGHQILARAFGGSRAVGRSQTPEYGWCEINKTTDSFLFSGLPDNFVTFQSHQDEVYACPPGFQLIANSKRAKIQAMENISEKIFGIQFHPEKNIAGGEISLNANLKTKGKQQRDCFFGIGKATKLYNPNVFKVIFTNFLTRV